MQINRSLPARGGALFTAEFRALLLVQMAFGFAFATFLTGLLISLVPLLLLDWPLEPADRGEPSIANE